LIRNYPYIALYWFTSANIDLLSFSKNQIWLINISEIGGLELVFAIFREWRFGTLKNSEFYIITV